MLALFAIPEMIALAVKGGSISTVSLETAKYSYRQLFEGVMEVPRHWWLALRTSIIGAVVGMIPGLGSSAAAWFCYGHAVQTSKTPERFGKGAVEGVIAPETGSNAREGGALLPTLFFGIPASSGMAVLMGAFLILGIQPGPTMITERLDLVWTLIWALVVGNLIAVTFLLFIMRWVVLLTFVNGAMLVPFIVVMAVVGSYVSEGQWQNLVVLVVLSAIGYGLLRFNWPRAPFVIGHRARQDRRGIAAQGAGAVGAALLHAAAVADPDRPDRAHHRLCGLSERAAAHAPKNSSRWRHEIDPRAHDDRDARDLHGDGRRRHDLSAGGALHAVRGRHSRDRAVPASARARPLPAPRIRKPTETGDALEAGGGPGRAHRRPPRAVRHAVGERDVHREHATIARERVRREIIVWGYFLGLIAGILLFGFRIAVPIFLIAFLRFQAGNQLAQRADLRRRLARSRCTCCSRRC